MAAIPSRAVARVLLTALSLATSASSVASQLPIAFYCQMGARVGGKQTLFITKVFRANEPSVNPGTVDVPMSLAFVQYILDHYQVENAAYLQSQGARAGTCMLRNIDYQQSQYARALASHAVEVSFTYGGTPVAAAPPAPPAPAAPAAVPHAVGHGLPSASSGVTDAGGSGHLLAFCTSDAGQPTIYMSDIFDLRIAPPAAHAANPPVMSDVTEDNARAYAAWLTQRYGFKSNSSFPSACLIAVDSASAIRQKQGAEAQFTAAHHQLVETGWTNADVVPSIYCASSAHKGVVYYTGIFPQNGATRADIQQAFFQYLKQTVGYPGTTVNIQCVPDYDAATTRAAELQHESSMRTMHLQVKETGWTYP